MRASRDELTAAAARATQGLAQVPASPAWAGLLLRTDYDHAHLACSDADAAFIARMPLLEQAEPGACVLPAKLFAEMLRHLPGGEVAISLTPDEAQVTCGKASFTLRTRPAGEYPLWSPPPAPLCTLDGAELAAGLRKVAPAASAEDPVLNGILLSLSDDTLTLAATDKYKLGTVSLPAKQVAETKHRTAMLPARIAEKFARACEGQASAGWDQSLVSLHSAGLLAVTRQSGARDESGQVKFPDWEKLFQGDRAWYACETAALARAARMAAVLADPDAMGHRDFRLELEFGDGQVAVTAGTAKQVVESGYDGEPVTLAVGGRNLLAGLNGCGELVHLAFTVPRRPLLLDSDGLRWLVQTRQERGT